MAGIIAIAIATVWSVLVGDVIVESARVAGSITLFGRTLSTPGSRPSILILCALAASAGLAWAAAVAYARGRRREREMAADLDARYQEMSTRAAGDIARAGLLSWQVPELRTTVQHLSERRDEIVAEMELARRRTSELKALADDYKRSVDELQERLIILPEIEDELARRRAQRQATDG